MRFTIRDVLWLTTLIAVALGLAGGWAQERRQRNQDVTAAHERTQLWANRVSMLENFIIHDGWTLEYPQGSHGEGDIIFIKGSARYVNEEFAHGPP